MGVLPAANLLYDKLFVFDGVENSVVVASATYLFAPLVLVLVSAVTDASCPGVEVAGALTGAAFPFAPAMYLYLLGLRKGDPTNVSVVSRSEPFLVMVLSAAFLGEVLSTVSYLDAGLVLTGVYLLF
jgi:EamA-like transporter family.